MVAQEAPQALEFLGAFIDEISQRWDVILATDTVKDVVVATNPSLRVVSASDRNVSHACAPSFVRPKTHVASEASDYRQDYTRLYSIVAFEVQHRHSWLGNRSRHFFLSSCPSCRVIARSLSCCYAMVTLEALIQSSLSKHWSNRAKLALSHGRCAVPTRRRPPCCRKP